MIKVKQYSGKIGPVIGVSIIIVLAVPFMRRMMESDMVLHMLVQIPLILFAGWSLARGCTEQVKVGLQRWNYAGIAGLLMTSLVLIFWMLPRALDIVLTNNTLELLKFLSLVMAGAALKLSWQAAGMIARGVFLGNVLPMMMVVGWLYIESPVRICNSYLSNDQLRTGRGLLALSIAGSLIWLYAFFISAGHGDRSEMQSNNSTSIFK
ncbi:MAG: hypothetical protein WC710_06060 [Gallionella sp.]